MKNNIDELLQQALSPENEPAPWLNQKILQTVKEKSTMKKRRFKKSFGAIIAAATMLIFSLGAVAGWKYLTPAQVAESFVDTQLAHAFESEDAIASNETQEFDNYRITLLGIVSGKSLSEYTKWDEQGKITDNKTYVVTAIENSDGSPRPDISADSYGDDAFYVSPYIQGLSMTDFNAHTLGGGYSEDVIEGIQYRIFECDNIEMFAYKTIYLGVTEGSAPNSNAFLMDEANGEIARNMDFDGVNALFQLPIPALKGDEAAANAYIEAMTEPIEEAETITDGELFFQELIALFKEWTVEDFETKATSIYSEELIPDSDGFISYDYETETHGSQATILMDALFPEMTLGLSEQMFISSDSETNENCYVETYELLENGNVMLRSYFYEVN